MSDLSLYSNTPFSRDWSLYFDHQVTSETMNDIFDSHRLQFLVWTHSRVDKTTIAWAQTSDNVTRGLIEDWFTDADWIGSTSTRQEFKRWFDQETPERYCCQRGTYEHSLLDDNEALGDTLRSIMQKETAPLSDQEVLWIAEGRL